ncbi:MAG: DUF805 domain-containing protein [Gammaproteobacteria bacterium]|nr:DUF805 domain-containing protein [Gammaproteobacteria bacterium]
MSEASLAVDANPYSTPDASLDAGHDEGSYQPKIFSTKGRIGRMRYLAYNAGANLILMAAVIPMAGGLAGLETMTDMSSTFGIVYVIANIVGLIIAIIWGKRRLNDLNRSGWWILLLLVPLVNFFIIIYLIAFGGSEEPNNYGPPPVANSMGVIILGSLIPVIFILGILAAILVPMIAG